MNEFIQMNKAAHERYRKMRGEDDFAQRASDMETLRLTLPPGGATAPAEWSPKRPENSAWREAVGALDLAPIIIALEWDWSLRPGFDEEMGASKDDVGCARLAVVAPASCLWRFSNPDEWRSLRAEASEMTRDQIMEALKMLFRRARPILEGLGDAWREEGTCATTMLQHYPQIHSGGFALATLARLNPGVLAIDPAEGSHGISSVALRAAELRGAADRLIHELGAGWVIEGAPGKEARHFVGESWEHDCEAKKDAVKACMAFWEARQLSQATPHAAAIAKAKAPRI